MRPLRTATNAALGHSSEHLVRSWKRLKVNSFAPNSIPISVQVLVVWPNHLDRSDDVFGSVSGATRTIDITGDRYAFANVTRMAFFCSSGTAKEGCKQ